MPSRNPQFDAMVSKLRRAMQDAGTNANDLAKRLGRDSSYIYNLLSGKKRSLGAGDMSALERLLELPPGALSNYLVPRANPPKPKQRSASPKSATFDRDFDEGRDVSAAVDWSKAQRPNTEIRRVNVDFPAWVVQGLDRQAQRLGVTRQALIKLWIAEKLG